MAQAHVLQHARVVCCIVGIERHQENVRRVCGSSYSLALWSALHATVSN